MTLGLPRLELNRRNLAPSSPDRGYVRPAQVRFPPKTSPTSPKHSRNLRDSTSFLTADQDLDPDFLTTARLAFSEKKEETGTRTEEQKAGFWHERYRRYVKRGSLSS